VAIQMCVNLWLLHREFERKLSPMNPPLANAVEPMEA
jgi:hypothetical protein